MSLTRTALPQIKADLLGAFRTEEMEANFGSLSTAEGYLPLKRLKLHGQISALNYQLRMTQSFLNSYQGSLEATYIFPLPARAAVSYFVMRTAAREVVGELQERGAARRNYDQAIAQGFQAAIAEEERGEIFTMRVGNIPAGESVEIELHLQGPLALKDDHAIFRFPLVVAPRYIPGQSLEGRDVGSGVAQDTDQVPDASRICPPVLLPGYPNPVHLSLDMRLAGAGLQWGQMESSLDELFLEEEHDGTQRLLFLPTRGKVNHDLILRIPVCNRAIQSSLQWEPDQEGGEATWCLTLVPPTQAVLPASKPRQLVVLLDRSGSMEGWKMAAARRTVARIIDSFSDHDRFTVLAFDNVVEEIGPDLAPGNKLRPRFTLATDKNRYRTVEKLSSVESRGGTEILPALEIALQRLSAPDGEEKLIILVTDGQVGNEQQILKRLASRPEGLRFYSVGIDQAVNAHFLEQMAQPTGGYCELVHSEEMLDKVMRSLCQRIGRPLLTDVRIGFPQGSTFTEQTPDKTDVYPGVVSRIYGRHKGERPDSVEVTALAGDGSTWRSQVAATLITQAPLRQLWARERLLDFEYAYVTGNSRIACSPAAITAFSLRHQVLCRFTSFVAVERSRVVSQGGPQHLVTQAVDLPAGWQMEAQASASTNALCARPALQQRMETEGQPPQRRVSVNAAGPMLSKSLEANKCEVSAVCDSSPPAPKAGTPLLLRERSVESKKCKEAVAPQKRKKAHAPELSSLADYHKALLEALQEERTLDIAETFEMLLQAMKRLGLGEELIRTGEDLLEELRGESAGSLERLADWLKQLAPLL